MKIGTWQTIKFESRGDHRGELVALEQLKEIPFQIKRVYYIIKTLDGVVRGLHAHRRLEQVLIAVSGSCTVRLTNGQRQEEFRLADCQQGLLISNLVWREMFDFTPDCVLLVLASELYDPSDYIRDHAVFVQEAKKFS